MKKLTYKLPGSTLSDRRFQRWGQRQLSAMKSLARGVVKEDRVSLGFPNRGYFERTRSIEAKEDAARPAAANQKALRDSKGAQLKLIMLA
jgi:hypothetical protein